MADLPLIIAFVVLAAYTYTAGLRAPALIAVVKDLLIYIAVIVAIVCLPSHFGGWGQIFDAASTKMSATNPATQAAIGIDHPRCDELQCLLDARARVSDGAVHVSALHHRRAGDQEPQHHPSQRRRAAAVLAHARIPGPARLRRDQGGHGAVGVDGKINPQLVVPQLFLDNFPSWFAGIALAAIAVGALVPAAIMSIAASNLFTRNIYRDLFKPDATPAAGG